MTPEGRVKRKVSELLKEFPSVYSLMPVQHGLGAAGLDYHCVVGVYYETKDGVVLLPIAFFIETKKPGDKPTPRQRDFIIQRELQQNARTFVIDEDPSINKGEGLAELADWLTQIEQANERYRTTLRPNP